MATKSIGREFRLTKDGKVMKVPVFHNASAKLKYKHGNSKTVRIAKGSRIGD